MSDQLSARRGAPRARNLEAAIALLVLAGGLPAVAVPEAYGGQGFSAVELGIVLQEMGRAVLCAPYFGSVALAATAVAQAATEEWKKELLPALASGEAIGTLALCEPAGRWDAGGTGLTATPRNG